MQLWQAAIAVLWKAVGGGLADNHTWLTTPDSPLLLCPAAKVSC